MMNLQVQYVIVCFAKKKKMTRQHNIVKFNFMALIMYVSRQAIKIKTNKNKEYILHKNEISISSVTTTFEMMTEQGGVEPKNRTAGTAETGRIQTCASNMWQ